MDYLDLTLPTPEENLALDEALLLEAEDGTSGEVLRFWELSEYAVILGSSARWQEEVMAAVCETDGVPILRRCSGGGTVLLGPGCLAFSLVLRADQPPLQDVTHSYAFILNRIRQALVDVLPGLAHAGKSDLAIGDLKVSGNSQRRKRTHLLHHGTILHDFDPSRIRRYLPLPRRQPVYRRDRSHEAFMTNVAIPVLQIKERICGAWSANQVRSSWPVEIVRQLVEEKYANPAWTRRR